MSAIVFPCPICGLDLSIAAVVPKEGPRNGDLGGHIHMEATGTVMCANAHSWDASGAFLLTRLP